MISSLPESLVHLSHDAMNESQNKHLHNMKHLKDLKICSRFETPFRTDYLVVCKI